MPGVASTNRTDDEGLADLARRAREVVASSSEDPELPPLAPPASFPEVDGFDEATAALGADEQAQLAEAAIGGSGEFDLYGYFTSGVCELAIASATGLRASQRTTDATCLALAASEGASGYAARTAWRAADLDPAAVAAEAAEKAARTRDAGEIEPGRYRAVLEPYAISELLYYFAFDSLNGLALLEERSFFSGRVGERAFDPKVTLVDDALDPRRAAEGVRLRGHAEAARAAGRGRRDPRPGLGSRDRGARRSRVDRARAPGRGAGVRPDPHRAGDVPRRCGVGGRARRARRRRDLRHPPPLPRASSIPARA